MKIKSIHLKDFKRFTDLKIEGIPETAKLVVMIGPNGCGKSSVFDAINCYTYIIENNIYPADDVRVGSYEPMNMMNYYLKNNVPRPTLRLSDGEICLDELDEYMEACDEYMEACHAFLKDCVEIVLHSKQEMEENELRVHTRSSLRIYSHLVHSDLYSTYSAKKLQLKLNKLPTEKEEDHTFALNIWALNVYEILHRSSLQEIFGERWPALPQELKDYAETVLSFREDVIREVSNATDQLITDPVSKLILEEMLHSCLSLSNSELLQIDRKTATFYNLSVGEIAILDLLLDIVIKKCIDDETIICIDEPELHIHTQLQAQLLEVLYSLISDNSQLWIATHSVGMVRKAQDLWHENPDSVVFLDFGRDDFDEQVTLKPMTPDPDFWARTYEVALGDLAELVITGRTMFCEGEEFDEECYTKIFKDTYPEIRFISLGARSNVEKSVTAANLALEKIAKSAMVIGIVDRDKATCGEIKRNAEKGIRTLSRTTLESYLLDDDVLTKLCEDHDATDKSNDLLAAKQNALDKNKLKSSDNLKSIVQPIHSAAQKILKSANLGNTRESFMMDVLAPRIQPGMKVYKELHKDIFGK